jgi:hypothetical protein
MYALFPVAFALIAVVGVLAHRRLELPLTEMARRALALSSGPPRASAVAVSPPPSRSAAAPR